MDSRNVSRTTRVCLAGRIWRVQRERVATGQNRRVHQRTGGTSPEDDVSGGISGVVEKTPYRIRRPVFVEMNFSRPGGTHVGGDDDPALKRRAIVGLSLPGRAKAGRKGTLFLKLFWDGTDLRGYSIFSLNLTRKAF